MAINYLTMKILSEEPKVMQWIIYLFSNVLKSKAEFPVCMSLAMNMNKRNICNAIIAINQPKIHNTVTIHKSTYFISNLKIKTNYKSLDGISLQYKMCNRQNIRVL